MRRKIIAAIMSVVVCSTAVLPVNASAEKRPGIGAWSSFLPGGFINDYFGGFDDDNSYSLDDEDNQEDGYWYDVGEWEDGCDYEDDYWYDAGVWDNDIDYEDGYWDDDIDYDTESGYDDEDYYEDELSASELAVNPEKKEIKKGKSFYISLVPADKSDWEGFSEEEWDEICEENIDSIEYSSTKKTVAYVNSFNGKVKARKKGSAVIKTTVSLVNGETVTLKTKVTVKK
ncbi:MAG: hypothetical protein K2K35_02020 [Lachnospiraceae bacterium]|nr:hypothetical protein [Lachnospiraceae bacterium]